MAPFLWLKILFPPFSDTGKPEKFGVDDAKIDRAIRSLEEERRTKKRTKSLEKIQSPVCDFRRCHDSVPYH
jgi:hypothetical protein